MFIVPLNSVVSLAERAEQVTPIQAGAGLPFQSMLQQAMEDFREAETLAKQDSYELATGGGGDLHTLAIHSAMQQTALEATVQITSRAVSAYKEVMQMQV